RCRDENAAVRDAAADPDALGRQPSTTFRASARQHLPTATRGHARAEAVRALAMQIARLKSSFHARVTERGRVERKQKDVAAIESRELYAAHSGPSICGSACARRIEAA